MRRISHGFTIIELLIVIAVIGILATISVVGFSRYQADTRDAQRSSKATILAEALEKYYDQNGEYPSCPAITGPATTVTTSVLPGVEQKTLVTPTDTSGTNSIKCQDLTSPSQGDYFAYVGGDTTSACLTGTACAIFSLKYVNETTGSINIIQSRRKVTVSGAPSINCPTNTFTTIYCTGTPVSGAISYDFQYATNSGFTTGLVSNSVSVLDQTSTGLSYCTNYYFRARAVGPGGPGSWSSTTPTTTKCLATPSCNATANSFTQITASWGTNTDATSFSLQYGNNSGFSPLTGSPTGITSTSYVATGLSYGTTYYFKVQAVVASGSSAWSPTCQVATLSLATPVATATVNSTSQVTASWGAIANAASYTVQSDVSSSFTSSPTTYSTTSTSQLFSSLQPGTTYYFRVQALNGSYTSPWSSTVTATTPSPVLASPTSCSGTYSLKPTRYSVVLALSEVSYDVNANQSNVNWSLYRLQFSQGFNSWDQTRTWPWSVSINGSGWSGSSNSVVFRTNTSIGATEGISSGSLTVQHDSSGNATIGFSGSDGPGSSIFGYAACSGTYTLSTLR